MYCLAMRLVPIVVITMLGMSAANHDIASAQSSDVVISVERKVEPKARRFVDAVLEDFANRGARRFKRTGLDAEGARRIVDKAYGAYIQGQLRDALALARTAIRGLREPLSTDAVDRGALRSLLMEALLIASQTSVRVGDKKAAAVYLEMIERAFPDEPLPVDKYSPESVKPRAKVAARMARRKRSRLELVAADDADVFVDGRKVGNGNASLRLHSGTYVVFAQRADATSEVKEVRLRPGKTKSVKLEVPTGAKLARGIADDKVVVLLHVNDNALIGRVVEERKIVRESKVRVGADEAAIAAFVRSLLGAGPVMVPAKVRKHASPKARAPRGSESFYTGLSGSAALGVGGVVVLGGVLLDGDRENGWLAVGSGISALGTTALAISAARSDELPTPSRILLASGALAMSAGLLLSSLYLVGDKESDTILGSSLAAQGAGGILFTTGLVVLAF